LSNAGGIDSLLAEAEALMASAEYARAAIAFEYVVYQTDAPMPQAEACLGKARAYKRMQDYEGALKSLARVNFRPLNDTMHYRVRSEMAFLLFLTGRFAEADQQFKQMDFFLPKLELKQQSYYLRVLTLNELRRWEEAETVAHSWIDGMGLETTTQDSLHQQVNTWYAEVPHLKKRKRAEVLSIFPGLGHWYAGHFGEGLVSSLVSVGALSFTVFNVFQGNYVTALTLGTGLLQLFLFGGTRRARFLVEETNYNRTRAFNNPLKAQLAQWQRRWVQRPR